MNYEEINLSATELVDSFASMEADTKWDQFLKLQNELAKTPVADFLATPEYIFVIFAGHVQFNDSSFVRKLRGSIEWPQENLEEHLTAMTEKKVASISASKIPVWKEIKEKHPSHAAMAIFIAHSLANNPRTKTFLTNLKK
ncbi:hypothetical protein [Haloferula sp. BvORR071]|uniref:hypothetical protein n=1 Tax=Haloferula sp. BvORR071 TaxID=1396141 RepID=UPI0005531A09|nr:hypothetical protein [Haloferula sp. BvORR071]